MPGEQRCTDLGSNCLCSAPFNNNDFSSITDDGSHTFSDDYDANGGECLMLDATSWSVQSVNAFDTPAGFSGKVFSYWDTSGDGLVHSPFNWGDDICSSVPSAKRVCVRVYKRNDATCTTPTGTVAPNHEIKFLESNSFQGNFDQDGTDAQNFRMVDGTCDDAHYIGPTMANMKTQWVRYEVCFEAPTGSLCDGSGAINLRVQTKLVDDDVEDTSSLTGCTDDNILGGRYIDEIHYNGWDTCNQTSSKRTYVTHYMVAAWDTTNGESGPWIGAAEEIEGEGEAGPTTTAGNRGGIRRGRVGLLR